MQYFFCSLPRDELLFMLVLVVVNQCLGESQKGFREWYLMGMAQSGGQVVFFLLSYFCNPQLGLPVLGLEK